MIMYELSSNQHCITDSREVAHQGKGLVGMSFSYLKQPNLVT